MAKLLAGRISSINHSGSGSSTTSLNVRTLNRGRTGRSAATVRGIGGGIVPPSGLSPSVTTDLGLPGDGVAATGVFTGHPRARRPFASEGGYARHQKPLDRQPHR